MSSDIRHRAVAAARYERTGCALVLIPLAAIKEALDPNGIHLLLLIAAVALGAGAGQFYRKAVAWWQE